MYPADAEKIIVAMERHGGSFVRSLAVCFRKADPINFEKLRQAFPEIWEEYRQWAQQDEEKIKKIEEEKKV
jgi:hypothetical protein